MKYCESIQKELTFSLDTITPCCNGFSLTAPKYNYKNQYNILDAKRNILNELNENIENSFCQNCIYIKEDNDISLDEIINTKYNSIFLRHWTTCNANCVYCSNKSANQFGMKPQYNPYEFIKNAYDNNLIDKENLTIRIQGGDLGVLENFNEFIELFEQYGFGTIHFSTNNIIYKPQIERILKQGKGSLNVSIDAGTRKTYYKIKRVDKFNECISNIKKYIAAGVNPNAFSVHYIIIQNYNNNKKEIKKFLTLMKQIGICRVGVRIDHKDLYNYLRGKTSAENVNKYRDLISYFYKEAEKLNLILDNDKCIEQNFALNKSETVSDSGQYNILKRIINKLKKKNI